MPGYEHIGFILLNWEVLLIHRTYHIYLLSGRTDMWAQIHCLLFTNHKPTTDTNSFLSESCWVILTEWNNDQGTAFALGGRDIPYNWCCITLPGFMKGMEGRRPRLGCLHIYSCYSTCQRFSHTQDNIQRSHALTQLDFQSMVLSNWCRVMGQVGYV